MKAKVFWTIFAVIVIVSSCTTGYYTRKGVYNFELLRYKKAAENFEKATQKKKPHPSSYDYLVKTYIKLRDYKKIAELGKANPEIVLGSKNIATDYCRSQVITAKDSIPFSELFAIQRMYPGSEEISNIIKNASDSSLFNNSNEYSVNPLKFTALDAAFRRINIKAIFILPHSHFLTMQRKHGMETLAQVCF
jgi:hypothetical protein